MNKENKEKLESHFSELKTISGNIYWIVDSPEKLLSEVDQLIASEVEKVEAIINSVYTDMVRSSFAEYEEVLDVMADSIKTELQKLQSKKEEEK